MAFEIEAKRIFKSKFGSYQDEPCVTFEHTGMFFNAKFGETFDFKHKSALLVLFDQKANLVGFRTPRNATEQDAAYKVSKFGKTFFVACSKFTKKLLPEQLEQFFGATLSQVSGIVTVDLSKPLS